MVMTDFGCVGCGYSIEDPEVNAMTAHYPPPKAAFYVVELGGELMGCGGIAPLAGGDAKTCELRKMYFLENLRGLGAGAALLTRCLDKAREIGYDYCYLETMDTMSAARKVYRRFGFKDLEAPLGDTGHGSCNSWLGLKLD